LTPGLKLWNSASVKPQRFAKPEQVSPLEAGQLKVHEAEAPVARAAAARAALVKLEETMVEDRHWCE